MAGIPGRMGTFVPNDIALGGAQHPAFIVLTGPNMGEWWSVAAIPVHNWLGSVIVGDPVCSRAAGSW
jgi:hypothetical protein